MYDDIFASWRGQDGKKVREVEDFSPVGDTGHLFFSCEMCLGLPLYPAGVYGEFTNYPFFKMSVLKYHFTKLLLICHLNPTCQPCPLLVGVYS